MIIPVFPHHDRRGISGRLRSRGVILVVFRLSVVNVIGVPSLGVLKEYRAGFGSFGLV